jgi:hypothetical protein
MPNKVQDFPALELPLTYRVSAESSLKFGGTRNVNETCLIAQHSESLRLLAIWSNQKGGERVPTKRERIGSSRSFCRVSEIASVENRSMREGGPCTTDDDPYLTRARKELGGGGDLSDAARAIFGRKDFRNFGANLRNDNSKYCLLSIPFSSCCCFCAMWIISVDYYNLDENYWLLQKKEGVAS